MRIAIIGGGAAGLMAAATLAEEAPDADVLLIERNARLGAKVMISGGGRCNVTTGVEDVRTVLTKYPRGGKFLSSAMFGFPPAAVREWFESRGVPLKTEADLRVFPVSDDGADVVRTFERLFADSPNVRVLLKTHVASVAKHGDGFTVALRDAPALEVDRVVLTTGGQAYRHTGSTGDGYAFAMTLGHSLTPLAPGLNAFFTAEKWPAEISGVSFTEATIAAHGTAKTSFTGPFLFTHKGVSGPAVFALASLTAFEPYDKAHPMRITIDLFPRENAESLQERLTDALDSSPAKAFRNVLATFVPKSVAELCVRLAALPGDSRADQTAKTTVRTAAIWLKGIPLSVVQRGGGDEFVTAGGIPLAEIDPSTMQSKRCPGLYFGGELMDVDGFTGGFNLQASWATGRLAGRSIAAGK